MILLNLFVKQKLKDAKIVWLTRSAMAEKQKKNGKMLMVKWFSVEGSGGWTKEINV